MEKRGVRPTAIRILVFGAIAGAGRAVSLSDIGDILVTVDKSSIFRTLEVFAKHHIVHSIDDGSGSMKYELCENEDGCTVDDMHTHFYCEKCHKTFCLKDINIPLINLPEGFTMLSVNYMVKGLCDACSKKP